MAVQASLVQDSCVWLETAFLSLPRGICGNVGKLLLCNWGLDLNICAVLHALRSLLLTALMGISDNTVFHNRP